MIGNNDITFVLQSGDGQNGQNGSNGLRGIDGTDAPDLPVRPRCTPGCHTCSNPKHCNSQELKGYDCGVDGKGSKGTDGGFGGSGGHGGNSGSYGTFKRSRSKLI